MIAQSGCWVDAEFRAGGRLELLGQHSVQTGLALGSDDALRQQVAGGARRRHVGGEKMIERAVLSHDNNDVLNRRRGLGVVDAGDGSHRWRRDVAGHGQHRRKRKQALASCLDHWGPHVRLWTRVCSRRMIAVRRHLDDYAMTV